MEMAGSARRRRTVPTTAVNLATPSVSSNSKYYNNNIIDIISIDKLMDVSILVGEAANEWWSENNDNFCQGIGGHCQHESNICHG